VSKQITDYLRAIALPEDETDQMIKSLEVEQASDTVSRQETIPIDTDADQGA